jgi:hypothetical protein
MYDHVNFEGFCQALLLLANCRNCAEIINRFNPLDITSLSEVWEVCVWRHSLEESRYPLQGSRSSHQIGGLNNTDTTDSFSCLVGAG